MTESNAAISAMMNWTYTSPRFFFSISAPCAFMLFAPKEYVDPFLRSQNIPDVLNPWVGLVALLMFSFIIVQFLFKLTWPFRKWIDNRRRIGHRKYM